MKNIKIKMVPKEIEITKKYKLSQFKNVYKSLDKSSIDIYNTVIT